MYPPNEIDTRVQAEQWNASMTKMTEGLPFCTEQLKKSPVRRRFAELMRRHLDYHEADNGPFTFNKAHNMDQIHVCS